MISKLDFQILIAVGGGILIALFMQWYELALGGVAAIPLLLLVRRSFLDGSLEARMLSISYMGGQAFCWLIGFLGCFYIFPLIDYPLVYLFAPVRDQIVKHTMVTMILVNLTMWGGAIGSITAQTFQKRDGRTPAFSPLLDILVRNSVWISGVLFSLFLLASFFSGAFSSRTLSAPPAIGSLLYVMSGIGVVSYLFFFFMGAYLRLPLFSFRNFLLFLILISSMILSGLTGGRGGSIRMLLFFLGGSLYSRINFKKTIYGTIGLIPFVLIFVVVVGAARGEKFSSDDFDQRITQLWYALTVKVPEKWKNRTYYFLRRVTNDLAGQLVIDTVVERQEFIGFYNFERIPTIFVPKFIIGQKPSADDGPERLRDLYQLEITNKTSIPITFMADSFERGGYFATFLCSFLLSFWLTCVGHGVCQFKWPLLRAVLLIAFAYHCFNIQTFSVIGTIRTVTYTFMRDALLIGGVIFAIYLFSFKHLKK